MAPRPPTPSTTIAIGIEPCPLPEGSLSKKQKEQFSSEMEFRQRRRSEDLAGQDLEDAFPGELPGGVS